MVCTRAEPWVGHGSSPHHGELCSAGSAWLEGITACPDDATGHACLFNMLCLSPTMRAHGPIVSCPSSGMFSAIHTLKHGQAACRQLLACRGAGPWSEEPRSEQIFGLGMKIMGWKMTHHGRAGTGGRCRRRLGWVRAADMVPGESTSAQAAG